MIKPSSSLDLANAARFLAVDAIERAGSGHPGMCMGMADAATVLFTRFLKFDPDDPRWPDRDRFVMSAGHGSALLYALLHLSGRATMTLGEIQNFRRFASRTPGHPEYDLETGVEVTTGPLGQGFANAVGLAIAERLMNARFGDSIVDHFTYVIVGDGCLMEGVSYEATALAGHLRLAKLIALWDDNRITVDGGTELISSEDQLARFRAAGWNVYAVDGHDHEAVAAAIAGARTMDRPSLIACRTTIAVGAPTKGGGNWAHGWALGADEIAGARNALGWSHPPFEIPEAIRAEWSKAGETGREMRRAWDGRLAAEPEHLRREFERWHDRSLAAGWDRSLNQLVADWQRQAPSGGTVAASVAILAALSVDLPNLFGGAADVASLTGADLPGDLVSSGSFAGRNLRFGIREHAMGAVLNGLASHLGFVPFGATYLTFSDCLRPALQMSAMMGLRVAYVVSEAQGGRPEQRATLFATGSEVHTALEAQRRLAARGVAAAVVSVPCWNLFWQQNADYRDGVLGRDGDNLLPERFRRLWRPAETLRPDAWQDRRSRRGEAVKPHPLVLHPYPFTETARP